ncbi:hypothetical protein, partial [Hydrogenimonas sp.]
MRKTVILLMLFSLFVGAYAAVPIAEYRMDECGWSGTSGEVEDSQGFDNNGTITGGGVTTSAGGILCRAGSFSGDAVDI